MTGLLASKTLESFDPSCLELPTSVELNWFTECRFIGAKQNLILQGPPGTGKTHFATALGLQACKQGYKCQMKRMATLVEELTAAYEAKELTAYKAIYPSLLQEPDCYLTSSPTATSAAASF